MFDLLSLLPDSGPAQKHNIKWDAIGVLSRCEEFSSTEVSSLGLLHVPRQGMGGHKHVCSIAVHAMLVLTGKIHNYPGVCCVRAATQVESHGQVHEFWHLNKDLLRGEPRGIDGDSYLLIA